MMVKVKDDLIAGKIRDVEKAKTRLGEAIDSLHDALSGAVEEGRITPKEATSVRAGFKGK